MLGIVKNELGVIFQNNNYKVVKKAAEKGWKIERHNHPDEEIVFTLIKGEVVVHLNEEEDYNLKAGDVLNFNGENSISVDFLESSEVVITLIKK